MASTNNNTFDAIIIGSGQGGKPLAVDLANAGWRTALIERDHLGGSCVNVGCTPTKTMVASARVAYLARRGAEYGVDAPNIQINMPKIRERKQSMVDSFRLGSEGLVERTDNLTLYRGEAQFTAPKELEISLKGGETVRLKAEKIFINVGARPHHPAIGGLDDVPFLDSSSIMELGEIPEHLIVLGGGYIGLEFGQMFRRFGSRVTIVQRGSQLLAREDSDVADGMLKIFTEDDIDVLLNSTVTLIARASRNQVEVTIKSSDNSQTLVGSHLLLATGRVPNSDSLNLDAAGIETDKRGLIRSNHRLETNIENVYVLGDVKGGPAFTHISYDDYRILKTNLLQSGDATIEGRLVPYTVFTDPQMGRVGLSEDEAKAQGYNFEVAKLPMAHVARALEMGETRGFMKAIVDVETKQILGCAILGIEGGEIMNMLHIAMMGKLPYATLRDTAFAHPTLGESLNNLFMTLGPH